MSIQPRTILFDGLLDNKITELFIKNGKKTCINEKNTRLFTIIAVLVGAAMLVLGFLASHGQVHIGGTPGCIASYAVGGVIIAASIFGMYKAYVMYKQRKEMNAYVEDVHAQDEKNIQTQEKEVERTRVIVAVNKLMEEARAKGCSKTVAYMHQILVNLEKLTQKQLQAFSFDTYCVSLHEAAKIGDMTSLKMRIYAGEDINQQNAKGETVLHIALQKVLNQVVENPNSVNMEFPSALFKLGAKTDIKDKNGVTPRMLWQKIQQSSSSPKRIYTEKNINQQNAKGETALHIALREVLNQIAENPNNIDMEFPSALLLTLGAGLDIKDKNGVTPRMLWSLILRSDPIPLHEAAKKGDEKSLRGWISQGKDIN